MQNETIEHPRTKDIITISNSWLYYRQPWKENYHYQPYTLSKIQMLNTLRLALTGDVSARESSVFKSTFIRFGWLDKGLKDLRWVSLSEVINDHYTKQLSKTNRTKLDHICRLLFISIKDIKHV